MPARIVKINYDCRWSDDPRVVVNGRADPGPGPGRGYFKIAKRTSLSDPARIETARWRAVQRHNHIHKKRWNKAHKKVVELGEAFLSSENASSTHQPLENYPMRFIASTGFYGPEIYIDSYFWEDEKITSNGSALEELAKAEALEEAKERKLNSITPEKLAAGTEYSKAEALIKDSWCRIQRINNLLATSVIALEILPTIARNKSSFFLNLNGRFYTFIAVDGKVKPETGAWPMCKAERMHHVPVFKMDNSCLGLKRSVIRTRFGEPSLAIATSKKDKVANVWVYGSVGVRFSRKDAYYSKVEKIFTSSEVLRLLKQTSA